MYERCKKSAGRKHNGWLCGYLFVGERVAKAWGLTPTQWDQLPALDKARMMAHEEAEAMMAAVDRALAEK